MALLVPSLSILEFAGNVRWCLYANVVLLETVSATRESVEGAKFPASKPLAASLGTAL
jgi:hypothetical protein